jgi:hypothetical protein
MEILLSDSNQNIKNFNVIHLHIGARNDRLYVIALNIVKCVYNIIQNVDCETTKTIIFFDNFIKSNPSSKVTSVCPEDIFYIDHMNEYFKKYNIVFITLPKEKLEILKMEYGLKGRNMVDITNKVKERCALTNDYFCVSQEMNLNSLCDQDPALGYPKRLYLHYKINDGYFLVAEDEFDSKLKNKLELDLIKNSRLESKKIEILKIDYGILEKNVTDITNNIRNHLIFNDQEFTISSDINLNSLCEDPLFGEPKKLYVKYKMNNDVQTDCIDEHSSKLVNTYAICLVPKIKTTKTKIENFSIEYEESNRLFIDVTEVKKIHCNLTDFSFSIKEDFDISFTSNIPASDLNDRITIKYKINSNIFSIVENNCNLKFNKNLDVNLITEEKNAIEKITDPLLFREILNEIKFTTFHEINVLLYLQNFANQTYYNKINVIHLIVDDEFSPFCQTNNMSFETYKFELNKKYYSLIDKYLKPSADEMNIILSSESNQSDLKEYLDFRLFNNVFIDKNCVDPENVQVLALLVGKSCNNIFIGNYNCNELKTSVSSILVSHIIPENARKILIDLNNIKSTEIVI